MKKKKKARNPFVLAMLCRKSGAMKDKRKKRKNGKNKQKEYLTNEDI